MEDKQATPYEEEELILTLDLDGGSQEDCIVLTIFPLNDKQYIALLPVKDAESEDAEIYLYGYREDADGQPILDDIEDEEEFQAVCERFDEVADEEDYTELTPDGPGEHIHP